MAQQWDLKQAQTELMTQLRTQEETGLSEIGDGAQQRLGHILYRRSGEMLDILELIETRVNKPEAKAAGRLEKWALHPVATMLLSAASMVQAFRGSTLAAGLLALAVLLQTGAKWLLGRRDKADAYTASAYLRPEAAAQYLTALTGRIRADSLEIAGGFLSGETEQRTQLDGEIAELYCSLYEMRLDRADDADVNWAFSVAESMLTKAGLESVEYGADTAAMFVVTPVPMDDITRCPAVRKADGGQLIRKGHHLQRF